MAPPVSDAAGLRSPPAAALALVPGLGDGAAPFAVERLPDGTVNDVYRIDTVAGSFVLRVDGAEWRRPGVDRGREAVLHGAAATAGLAPPIVCMRPDRGVLVTEFLPGRMWSADDFRDPGRLAQLGERLGRLHALAAPRVASFDPLGLARIYVAAATRRAKPTWFATRVACEHVLRELDVAVQQVAAADRRPAIVHGDLMHTNLLQGERLWLLDFEYAQIADPLYDVGCVLAYYPAALPHAAALLAAACPGARVTPGELEAATYVHRALAWLWHLARGESATPP
jgi:aminoglycoside phosphotransferase (APT) family kinase protein